MDDGTYLAFFELSDMPFEFKVQYVYDLYIALEVDAVSFRKMLEKGRAQGVEACGISGHGFVDSIYFRDQNGFVIELCAKRPGHDAMMDPAANSARDKLRRCNAATSVAGG